MNSNPESDSNVQAMDSSPPATPAPVPAKAQAQITTPSPAPAPAPAQSQTQVPTQSTGMVFSSVLPVQNSGKV